MLTQTQTLFIEAVSAMTAMPEDYVEHMKAMAPLMSDEQCEALLAKIAPLHAEAEKMSNEILQEADAATKDIHAFRKEELPKLVAEAEAGEHSAAESIFDDQA